jgi:hypothetical protein
VTGTKRKDATLKRSNITLLKTVREQCMVTACFGISDTTTKLLSRGLSKAMSETEAGFNTDIVVKELLDLLVSKHILNKREVDKLLQSAKTRFNEVPEEPDINDINDLV